MIFLKTPLFYFNIINIFTYNLISANLSDCVIAFSAVAIIYGASFSVKMFKFGQITLFTILTILFYCMFIFGTNELLQNFGEQMSPNWSKLNTLIFATLYFAFFFYLSVRKIQALDFIHNNQET